MQEISFDELEAWRASDKPFVLIDVREPEEHYTNNIGGILVPLSDINKALPILETSLPVVVYCRKGIRSQIAIQRWRRKFPDTTFLNLTAGIRDVHPKK